MLLPESATNMTSSKRTSPDFGSAAAAAEPEPARKRAAVFSISSILGEDKTKRDNNVSPISSTCSNKSSNYDDKSSSNATTGGCNTPDKHLQSPNPPNWMSSPSGTGTSTPKISPLATPLSPEAAKYNAAFLAHLAASANTDVTKMYRWPLMWHHPWMAGLHGAGLPHPLQRPPFLQHPAMAELAAEGNTIFLHLINSYEVKHQKSAKTAKYYLNFGV